MLLPFKSKNPPESFPVATVILIAANVVVYALTTDRLLVVRDDAVESLALHAANLNPINLFTHMFLHGEPLHLLGNMWFLYLFGFAVEGRLRTAKFLAVYFAAGIIGALLHIAMFSGTRESTYPMLGASGAIMGTMGAALYMFPFAQMNFIYFFGFLWYGITTWAMMWVAAYYVALDVLGVVVGGGGVANWAHLGGVAGGFLVCWVFRAGRDSQRASEAKAIYSDTKDLRYLSPSELGAMVEQNKNDTRLALNWMMRSLRDSRGPSADCHKSFHSMLPQIVLKERIQDVAWTLAALSRTPGEVNPSQCLAVAMKVERVGEPTLALQLYDAALSDPKTSASDCESALYHAGLLCELRLNNAERAVHAYRQLIDQFPMSPFAEHARLHLQKMGRA